MTTYVGLEEKLIQMLTATRRDFDLSPIILGGIAGSGGGIEGRPGGFVGYLPQIKVAYDLSELSTSGTAGSPTLLDNLNHMRHRLSWLEESGTGGMDAIKNNDILIASGITVLDFSSDFGVVINPSGEANITIDGLATSLDELSDVTLDSVSDNDLLQYNSGTGEWENETVFAVMDDIYVNESGDTMTGRLYIDGGANEIQLRVEGSAGQVADIFRIDASGGGALLTLTEAGRLNLYSNTYPQQRFVATKTWAIGDSGGDFTIKNYTDTSQSILFRGNDDVDVLSVNLSTQLVKVPVGNLEITLGDVKIAGGALTVDSYATFGAHSVHVNMGISIEGTIDNVSAGVYGLYMGATTYKPAISSIAYGHLIQMHIDTGYGDIAKAYALYIEVPTKTGANTVNQSYGIKILDQTLGATANFALYTGTGIARFGDQMLIVGSQDITQLQVYGYSTQSGDIAKFYHSSGGTLVSISDVFERLTVRKQTAGASETVFRVAHDNDTDAVMISSDLNRHAGIGIFYSGTIKVSFATYAESYINNVAFSTLGGLAVGGTDADGWGIKVTASASGAAYLAGDTYITGSVGVGITPISASKLAASKVFTETSGAVRSIIGIAYASPTATSTTNLTAISGSAESTTTQDMSGAKLIGVTGNVWVTGATTYGNVYGLNALIRSANASSTITNAFGVYSQVTTLSGGVITNAYGLYIVNVSSGTSLNYAIYTNLGKVRLGDDMTVAGQVTIGSHTAYTNVSLSVEGTVINASGGVYGIYQGSVTLKPVAAGGAFGQLLQVHVDTGFGVVANAYAIYIQDATKTGANTVTTNYALRILGQTLGTSANYAIYTQAGLVRFGDRTLILGTQDDSQLVVYGYSSQTASIVVIKNSGGTTLSQFDANGWLGISSTLTPTAKLSVFGSNTDLIHLNSSDTGIGIAGTSMILWVKSDSYIGFSSGARTGSQIFRVNMDTQRVVIGATAGDGKLTVDGTTNIVQLLVKGHSTQILNIFEIETDGSAERFTVSNSGLVTITNASFTQANSSMKFIYSSTLYLEMWMDANWYSHYTSRSSNALGGHIFDVGTGPIEVLRIAFDRRVTIGGVSGNTSKLKVNSTADETIVGIKAFSTQNAHLLNIEDNSDNTLVAITASGVGLFGTGVAQTNVGYFQTEGYWTFKEDAGDPTADTDYGKIWTKSDNTLYFQDGAGVTHTIDMDGGGGGSFVSISGDTMTGQLYIDGSADEVQLLIAGHSTQTSDIFEIQNSGGTKLVHISNEGFLTIGLIGADYVALNLSQAISTSTDSPTALNVTSMMTSVVDGIVRGIASTPLINTANGDISSAYALYAGLSELGVNDLISAYGLAIESITAGVTNNYSIYTQAGLVRFGDAVTIENSSALPVITLEQTDVDEDFFKFIGTSDTNVDRALVDAVDFPNPGSIVGWIKINVRDDQSTNPIVDGDYYVPFYSAPTA